jgi:hypothetical protein
MPRGDRRGPNGMGPMTGRGLGYCNNYSTPGFTKGVPRGGAGFHQGYGRGMGRGFGRGYRNFDYPSYPLTQNNVDEGKLIESEMEILKNQMSILEKRLSEIKKVED